MSGKACSPEEMRARAVIQTLSEDNSGLVPLDNYKTGPTGDSMGIVLSSTYVKFQNLSMSQPMREYLHTDTGALILFPEESDPIRGDEK